MWQLAVRSTKDGASYLVRVAMKHAKRYSALDLWSVHSHSLRNRGQSTRRTGTTFCYQLATSTRLQWPKRLLLQLWSRRSSDFYRQFTRRAANTTLCRCFLSCFDLFIAPLLRISMQAPTVLLLTNQMRISLLCHAKSEIPILLIDRCVIWDKFAKLVYSLKI